MSGDISDIYNKQKYAELFDGGILSMHSSNKIEE